MSYNITSLTVTPKEVPSYYKRLSICVKSNGFSFSRTTTQGILLTFGEIEMDMNRSISDLSADLKQFFAEARITPFDFEDMHLVVPSDNVVWVPRALFAEGHEREYIEPLCAPAAGMNVFASYNEAVDAYGVFVANSNIVTAFRIVLPGVEVCCQHSALLTPTLLQASQNNPLVLLHQRRDRCDCEVCNEGKLLLSNTYMVRGNDERLFRALQLMKTFGLENDNFVLLIAGEVDRLSYASLQGFFPRIMLYNGTPLRYINPEFRQLHCYRHILSLS